MDFISRPSPNFEDRRGGARPKFIILHYTDMTSCEAALQRMCDPQAKVSAHYCIDEDGQIYKLVDEEKRAWHAGQSYWRGESDINSHSIGIELVNPGHSNGYREFPALQIQSLVSLCLDIMDRHSIKKENVLAHSDIAPDRKIDPGELFPWREVSVAGVGVWPDNGLEGGTLDFLSSLIDYGYDPSVAEEQLIAAFQRHYVPEVFQGLGKPGIADDLTKNRLKGLLTAAFA